MGRDTGLSAMVEDDELVIRIGIDVLKTAIEASDYFQPYNEKTGEFEQIMVNDPATFAKSMAYRLNDEAEDGETLIYAMLDKAAETVVEQGDDGVDTPEAASTKEGE